MAYQMGSMDALASPDRRERAMLEDVCRTASATPGAASNARMITDAQLEKRLSLTRKDPQLYRVATVGRSVVRAAKRLVDDAAASAAGAAMEGEWTYVVLDSPNPNAFVTALPRKVFVTTALLDRFVDNDDEMALILGHETSHLLLGHVKKGMIGKIILDALEMLILTAVEACGGIATGGGGRGLLEHFERLGVPRALARERARRGRDGDQARGHGALRHEEGDRSVRKARADGTPGHGAVRGGVGTPPGKGPASRVGRGERGGKRDEVRGQLGGGFEEMSRGGAEG